MRSAWILSITRHLIPAHVASPSHFGAVLILEVFSHIEPKSFKGCPREAQDEPHLSSILSCLSYLKCYQVSHSMCLLIPLCSGKLPLATPADSVDGLEVGVGVGSIAPHCGEAGRYLNRVPPLTTVSLCLQDPASLWWPPQCSQC